MPLPDSVRSALDSVPELNRTTTPSTLRNYQLPAFDDLSYSRFEFDEAADKLGTGGNAVVYQATVTPDNDTVALKRPFPGRTIPNQTVRQLLNEGKKWAAVDDHPYIASVFDWGMDGPPWIAIEYLSGGTLQDRIEDLGLLQRLWTAYALIDAVAYATGQHGLTHHDLHPQNILFQQTPSGIWDVPKIVDWGLSRELIQHTGSVSQATPDYAAPEQFDALMPDVRVGPHTDVYQLGVVCYELLTGEYPNHLGDDITPPSQIKPALPAEIDALFLQALAHDRDNRIAHPLLLRENFRRELERAIGTEPTAGSPNAGHERPDTNVDRDGSVRESGDVAGYTSDRTVSDQVTGEMDFVNDTGGYGFIRTNDVDEDVFIHFDDIEGGPIQEGDRLRVDVIDAEKGPRATNVTKITNDPPNPQSQASTSGSATSSLTTQLKNRLFGSSGGSLIDSAPPTENAVVEYLNYETVEKRDWNPYVPSTFERATEMGFSEENHGIIEVGQN
jgi:serine/threonine protein kinase